MARLTRPESQARTRADLLATAHAMFLRDGYAKTSLERVAEEAGYSKGAVYSNFKTKSALCLEVLELIHETKFAELSELLGGADTLDARLAGFQDWAERTLGDVGWTLLEFEFAIVARDDPDLQAAITSNLGMMRGAAAAQLQALADSLGVVLPMSAADSATTILSLGLGLGIQRAVDPGISAGLITDAVRAMLAAAQPIGEVSESAGSTRRDSAAGSR
ncbi:TetR/AcrR family transcriptional regulator [Nocardia yunnanensis]|uniref:TetR/AcrR family transcriptional regulator n=1 Tax=Nocardia yunnanensis TaxID=2382165 RepID=A0A386ZD39_9NOCA|nr:TetR/AcrR family transcriptional regulator [Nocardia yunnanensis]AYF75034.1 TetR/AcrR family transcriptional regulator [Nocardia yunnanensis]